MKEKLVVLKNEDYDKQTINYSRDYRHLNRNIAGYMVQVLLVLGPLVIGYLFVYNKLSYYISKFAMDVLERMTGKSVGLAETNFFPKFGSVYYVNMQGKNPSFTMSLLSLIITLILIVICSHVKNNKKSLMVFITIGLYIHLVSSVYFIVFGSERFPYDLNQYSGFYMKQQIIVWLMIIVIYWLSTSLITKVPVYRVITFLALAIISFVFGVARYIVYMFILAKCSYLFMATLYFTFGMLFDFIIMVGIYSIFMKYASQKFRKITEGGLWKWS